MTQRTLLNNLYQSAAKFLKNKSGNVAIIFSFAAFPMVALIGGAIDVQRIAQSKIKLQSAADASTLAAASFRNSGESTEEFVENYIRANIAGDNNFQNLKVEIVNEEITQTQRTITVKTEAEVPFSFLQLAGVSNSIVEVNSTAIEARGKTEYSLVLDISTSMSGDKIDNLRTASHEFIDAVLDGQLKDTTSLSLIPFGGSVNLGKLFNRHVVDEDDAIVNPSKKKYDIGYNVPKGKFRFTDGKHIRGNHKQCVELIQDDYDLDRLPVKQRSQIPHFFYYKKFHPWCPDENSAAIWNSNDTNKLKKRINKITLSDGTGMDHGTLWGAKALSPAMRGLLGGEFPDRPADFDDVETQKVIVIMSDGAITGQQRPRDYKKFTKRNGDKVSKKEKKKYYQRVVQAGDINDTSSFPTSNGYFKKVCEDLKQKGVYIYTIGFLIEKESEQEKLLQYCASNPANYYLVETLNISAAFEAIAASVKKLRVSG